jgi:hypothetical protein
VDPRAVEMKKIEENLEILYHCFYYIFERYNVGTASHVYMETTG